MVTVFKMVIIVIAFLSFCSCEKDTVSVLKDQLEGDWSVIHYSSGWGYESSKTYDVLSIDENRMFVAIKNGKIISSGKYKIRKIEEDFKLEFKVLDGQEVFFNGFYNFSVTDSTLSINEDCGDCGGVYMKKCSCFESNIFNPSDTTIVKNIKKYPQDINSIFLKAVFIDENTCFRISGGHSISKTINNGQTWQTIEFDEFFTFYDIDFVGGLISVIGSKLDFVNGRTNGLIITSHDDGETWSENLIIQEDWIINSISFTDNQNGFCSSNDIIYKTTYGGINWTAYFPDFSSPINKIKYVSNNCVLVLLNDGSIYKSIDGGINWDLLRQGNGYSFDLSIYNENLMVIYGWEGMYYTIDGWQTEHCLEANSGFELVKFIDENSFITTNQKLYREGECSVYKSKLNIYNIDKDEWICDKSINHLYRGIGAFERNVYMADNMQNFYKIEF